MRRPILQHPPIHMTVPRTYLILRRSIFVVNHFASFLKRYMKNNYLTDLPPDHLPVHTAKVSGLKFYIDKLNKPIHSFHLLPLQMKSLKLKVIIIPSATDRWYLRLVGKSVSLSRILFFFPSSNCCPLSPKLALLNQPSHKVKGVIFN